MINMLDELEKILKEYADDENYHITTMECKWVTNGVKEEIFYEFYGDSEPAKRGLEIIKELRLRQTQQSVQPDAQSRSGYAER